MEYHKEDLGRRKLKPDKTIKGVEASQKLDPKNMRSSGG